MKNKKTNKFLLILTLSLNIVILSLNCYLLHKINHNNRINEECWKSQLEFDQTIVITAPDSNKGNSF